MKRDWTNIAVVICMFILLMSMTGCEDSAKSNEESENTLTVITEASFQDNVNAAVKYMKEELPDTRFRIQVLPINQEERDTEIQKLRTQIMAGSGPDVYLINNFILETPEFLTPLFENPYKTMQGGVLASLDSYMEKDAYWNEGNYKKEFLAAGQSEGKQYIIPLSCRYKVLMSETGNMDNLKGKTLEEWLEEAKLSDNAPLKSLVSRCNMWAGQWIGNAADYEKREVLFDKQKWETFFVSHLMYKREEWENLTESENVINFSDRSTDMREDIQAVEPIPDLNGKRLATVQAFGAVGMSCDDKENAYRFLMLFLNDEVQREMAKQGKYSVLNGCIDMEMPVSEMGILNRAKEFGVSDEAAQTALEGFRSLDGAYFITGVEKFLTDSVEEVSWRFDDPNADLTEWEAKASEFAEKAWNDYKMLIAE